MQPLPYLEPWHGQVNLATQGQTFSPYQQASATSWNAVGSTLQIGELADSPYSYRSSVHPAWNSQYIAQQQSPSLPPHKIFSPAEAQFQPGHIQFGETSTSWQTPQPCSGDVTKCTAAAVCGGAPWTCEARAQLQQLGTADRYEMGLPGPSFDPNDKSAPNPLGPSGSGQPEKLPSHSAACGGINADTTCASDSAAVPERQSAGGSAPSDEGRSGNWAEERAPVRPGSIAGVRLKGGCGGSVDSAVVSPRRKAIRSHRLTDLAAPVKGISGGPDADGPCSPGAAAAQPQHAEQSNGGARPMRPSWLLLGPGEGACRPLVGRRSSSGQVSSPSPSGLHDPRAGFRLPSRSSSTCSGNHTQEANRLEGMREWACQKGNSAQQFVEENCSLFQREVVFAKKPPPRVVQ
mmetsp:Transcript_1295/g.3090  ORF Transcript_1295/g.3090 Transcript_1295/m.3090 type:complete len:405 (-) Transcript_1295:170-1384(-)